MSVHPALVLEIIVEEQVVNAGRHRYDLADVTWAGIKPEFCSRIRHRIIPITAIYGGRPYQAGP